MKNMLAGWHNFFFVAYDAGFVAVDKPPLGLWIQAAFAYVLGFHGWSILLPQALAGVASVAVLYHLVARTSGRVAGLLAGHTFALTPIVVATSRNNTADMLLVLAGCSPRGRWSGPPRRAACGGCSSAPSSWAWSR